MVGAEIVGVEHVGLGTDMPGVISPPVSRGYEQFPSLGAALLSAGFSQPTDFPSLPKGGRSRMRCSSQCTPVCFVVSPSSS
jgi:hypothetical protein